MRKAALGSDARAEPSYKDGDASMPLSQFGWRNSVFAFTSPFRCVMHKGHERQPLKRGQLWFSCRSQLTSRPVFPWRAPDGTRHAAGAARVEARRRAVALLTVRSAINAHAEFRGTVGTWA